MRRLDVGRMRRHRLRSTPDVFTIHQDAEDAVEWFNYWRDHVAQKYAGARDLHIDASVDTGSGVVTAVVRRGARP